METIANLPALVRDIGLVLGAVGVPIIVGLLLLHCAFCEARKR